MYPGMIDSQRIPGYHSDALAVKLEAFLKASLPLLFAFHRVINAGGDCSFPRDWRGDWFENHLGNLTISSTGIDKKGDCIESRDNYYLLENTEIHCFVCLLIERRHANVLQFKESFCSGKESLQTICSTIQAETLQHTLIRDIGIRPSCPFQQDAYHFNYNNNSGGTCRSPISYARPCASPSVIALHFSRCPDTSYTHEQDVNLECIATWRDGSEHHLIGKLIRTIVNKTISEYRCFLYRQWGSVIYAAMSADSSCRGLRTAKDGPVVFEFTQDAFVWPKSKCMFPSWFTRHTWRDLGARYYFRSNEAGDVITFGLRQVMTSSSELDRTFRCSSLSTDNTSNTDEFTAVVFAAHACTTGYACIKLTKKKDGILEFSQGNLTESENKACLETNWRRKNIRLLIPEVASSPSCPFHGRYNIHTGTSVCPSYLRSGCNGSLVMDIVSSCSTKPGLQLECLQSWHRDKRRYVIARLVNDVTDLVNCFSIEKKGENLLFSTDSSCNTDAPYILKDRISYLLNQTLLSCETAGESATSNGASSSVVTRQAAAHVKEPEAQQNIRKSIEEEEEDESEYTIEDDINHDRGAWLITSGCGSISFPSSTRETTCFKLFLFWIGLVIGTISLRHHPTTAVLLL